MAYPNLYRRYPLLILVACCLLSACAPATVTGKVQTVGEYDRVLAYACDCVDITAAYSDDETLWLFLPGETVHLPHVPSAAGAKYSDGTVSFWSKGEGAILEVPEDIYPDCKIDRKRSVWEEAKLRGVDFRAVGQEPGWHLEIGPSSILVVLDYGGRSLDFPTPLSQEDPVGRRTIYESRKGGHSLTVFLEGQACTDSMSGEGFETTVTVTVDGQVYRGCGRALH